MDEAQEVSVLDQNGPNPDPLFSSSSPEPDHDHADQHDGSLQLCDQLQNLDLECPVADESAGRIQDPEIEERSGWNGNGYGSGSDVAVGYGGSARNDEETKPFFPVRPGAEDCAYYMKTGNCKFGSSCKFNHPIRRSQGLKDGANEREEHSERLNQIECKYYLRSGGCKYGKACKYSHGKASNSAGLVSELNFLGLPIRQGAKECPYYMRTGSCKFGANCKFNHPDPTYSGRAGSPSGYGSGVAGGLVSSQAAPQAGVASWSSSVLLNGTTPCVSVIFSPTQGTPQNAEWNGYQAASAYSLQRNMLPNAYIMNNPSSETSVYSQYYPQPSLEEFPERPGQPECSYYLKTGDCKYRSRCKYHHPKNRNPTQTPCVLSDNGLPLRPGQKICANFSRYGICKFGPACRYDHSIQQHTSSSEPRPYSSPVINGSPTTANDNVNGEGNESDGWN